MRLTKKRLRALDTAFHIDDVLYEKFRRLSDDLLRREAAFARRKQVVKVLRKIGNVHEVMQILDVQSGPEGTIVICR